MDDIMGGFDLPRVIVFFLSKMEVPKTKQLSTQTQIKKIQINKNLIAASDRVQYVD